MDGKTRGTNNMIDPKIGDTVKLVSGGPSMTVGTIGEGNDGQIGKGHVECYWYDASGALQVSWYPVAALIPAPKVGGS